VRAGGAPVAAHTALGVAGPADAARRHDGRMGRLAPPEALVARLPALLRAVRPLAQSQRPDAGPPGDALSRGCAAIDEYFQA
jgi:hypothetical protein